LGELNGRAAESRRWREEGKAVQDERNFDPYLYLCFCEFEKQRQDKKGKKRHKWKSRDERMEERRTERRAEGSTKAKRRDEEGFHLLNSVRVGATSKAQARQNKTRRRKAD
jgi:hypothetical protein